VNLSIFSATKPVRNTTSLLIQQNPLCNTSMMEFLTMKQVLYKIVAMLAVSLPLVSCGGDNDVISSAFATDMTSQTARQRLDTELSTVGVGQFTAPDYKPGLVRHIVLFRYKDTVTAAQREDITQRFLALQNSPRNGAPYIVSIEEGMQNSGENADQGLQQGFLVTFRSEGDRNYYVGQPIVTNAQYYDAMHQQFKDFVGPYLAAQGVVVFDYTVARSAP
jgi:hypothetical protein